MDLTDLVRFWGALLPPAATSWKGSLFSFALPKPPFRIVQQSGPFSFTQVRDKLLNRVVLLPKKSHGEIDSVFES